MQRELAEGGVESNMWVGHSFRRVCAGALVAATTSGLLAHGSAGAQAATSDSELGKLSLTSKVHVVGNRCGKVNYHWDGWESDLGWTDGFFVVLYRGGPNLSPYDRGYNAIDSAFGTEPWVNGYDDDPEFAGSFRVCTKADSTKPVTLWGQEGDGTNEYIVPTRYVVDYHPVKIEVTTFKTAVKARVLKDGKAWAGQTLKVAGLGLKLKTDAKGIARLKRSSKTKGKTVGFDLSDIAKSKRVKL